MQIEVIIGVSIFGNGRVVGVALRGAKCTHSLCSLADTLGRGRPAAVEQIRKNRSDAEEIAYIVGRWTEWAVRCGIDLTINAKPREVGAF